MSTPLEQLIASQAQLTEQLKGLLARNPEEEFFQTESTTGFRLGNFYSKAESYFAPTGGSPNNNFTGSKFECQTSLNVRRIRVAGGFRMDGVAGRYLRCTFSKKETFQQPFVALIPPEYIVNSTTIATGDVNQALYRWVGVFDISYRFARIEIVSGATANTAQTASGTPAVVTTAIELIGCVEFYGD